MKRLLPAPKLDPQLALRPGRFDPIAVLVVWCMRKAFFPLFWLGMIFATTSGRVEDIDAAGGINGYVTGFRTVGEVVAALLSPLVVIFAAFGLRFLAAGLSLLLAYPLTRWSSPTDHAHGRRSRSRTRMWSDRWHLTQAYRSLRATWAVRRAAAQRLGDLGRRLELCTPVLRWAGFMLLVAYFVAAIIVVSA